MTTYIRIYLVLKNGNWHKKSDFCRPFSADIRRLEEMKNSHNWIDFEKRIIRKDGKVSYSEYRLTKIYPEFWEYARKFNILRVENNGQKVFA